MALIKGMVPGNYLFAATISFTAIACTSDTNLQRQAQDFCTIHLAQSWQHIEPGTSANTLAEERDQRISEAITSSSLMDAIEWAERQPKSQATYQQLQQRIESITNASWECPEYLSFHVVSFVRADVDDSAQHTVEIYVSGKHDYLLEDQAYSTISAEMLESSLEGNSPEHSQIRVILREGATDDALPPIFNAAQSAGITSITVVSE
ncbi:hypothetical protein [Halopseudomonas salegens]|uniref:Lipoprotein n=1 Tax=Halopseudomonas salegens TaxID=1434072 RepID=A0A1H2HDL0_9GAMM|nr:hypothetical protein [Halopseudomonas salegens]SDU29872.1 hypothetical protein SAMN05216210_2961 [Halopseudomonas salegens]